jgi:hypothetical protein
LIKLLQTTKQLIFDIYIYIYIYIYIHTHTHTHTHTLNTHTYTKHTHTHTHTLSLFHYYDLTTHIYTPPNKSLVLSYQTFNMKRSNSVYERE